MTTTLMTGSASGIGAATREALIAAGHLVIGIDLKNADIVGDLSTAAGRQAVIQAALERCGHQIDHLVLCAGLGAQTQPASLVTSVNFFGAVELLDGLLPALQKGSNPSAVVISSVASAMLNQQ
jgi:NAD(P)-dependent dehydrogenase (short-subunit alcohol dehydrogenase family)